MLYFNFKLFSEQFFFFGEQNSFIIKYTIADIAYQNMMKNKKCLDHKYETCTYWVKYFITFKKKVFPNSDQQGSYC